MKHLLPLAAAGEAATGLVLLVYPSIVVRVLFDGEIAGSGTVMSRIAGMALIGLGLACWPAGASAAVAGMLMYSVLAALYLLYLGLAGESIGPLLWPAVVAHMILTLLLVRQWLDRGKTPARPASRH